MNNIYRAEFLDQALSCGAILTGKPNGSEAITVLFSIEAWRKFDLLNQAQYVSSNRAAFDAWWEVVEWDEWRTKPLRELVWSFIAKFAATQPAAAPADGEMPPLPKAERELIELHQPTTYTTHVCTSARYTADQMHAYLRADRAALAARKPAAPIEYMSKEYIKLRADEIYGSEAPSIPAQAAVPDGWKLVPVKPTEAMTEAGRDARLAGATHMDSLVQWRAMLAAAPSAPSTLGQQVAAAQAEVAGWSDDKRASVRLEGGDPSTQPADGGEDA